MPAAPDNGELPEFPLTGPFGGVQSELSPPQIERIGFRDAINFMFIRGVARVRPKFDYTAINAQPALVAIQDLSGTISGQTWFLGGYITPSGEATGLEPWTQIYDFYAANGSRRQVAATTTRVMYLTGLGWSPLTGTISSTPSQPVNFAVVANTLLFSEGITKVQAWDGITSSFADVSANAVPAKYLVEFGGHLLAMNTLEGGSHAYQRIRWTAAGDPTDWTSANAGQVDLNNDLGPINGCLKLGRYVYIFQQKGLVQVSLTGNGLKPFFFDPISAKSKGLAVPRSLAANGELTGYYIGKDNIYRFDGQFSTPIGDMPIDTRIRLGARSRILADLALASRDRVIGFVTTSVNGNAYNAYWVIIPNVAIWVFNIDDSTWSRWSVGKEVTCIGDFTDGAVIQIKDLIGTIAEQQWTPSTLTNSNPFDSVMLGCDDGSSALFNFTGWSELGANLTTGEMEYGDARHDNVTKKMRVTYKDTGTEIPVTFRFTNELGEEYSYEATFGVNANNAAIKAVIPVNIPATFVTMKIDVDAGVPFEMTSFAPIYSQGGEVR